MKPQPLRPNLAPLEVAVYGRWFFLVGSNSRPGLEHFVDLEPSLDDEGNVEKGGQPFRCSCEAHFYHVTRPCIHLKAVLKFLRPLFKWHAAFKPASSFQTKRYELDPNKKFTNPSGRVKAA